MASSLVNVCRFNPTAGGTTDWTYSSAVTGYQSPTAAGAVNGSTYSYRAESSDLSQWEVGTGAYSSGTGVFARTAVLFNSLGTTAKVNFSAAPQVAIVALKEDFLALNDIASFFASLSANQTGITDSTFTKVLNNTEAWDTNSWYDNATNYRFTPQRAGRYRVHANIQCNGTTITVAIAAIYKNGSIYLQGSSAVSGGFASASADAVIQFNGSTDYVEMFGYITAVSGHLFGGGSAPIRTFFEAHYISP